MAQMDYRPEELHHVPPAPTSQPAVSEPTRKAEASPLQGEVLYEAPPASAVGAVSHRGTARRAADRALRGLVFGLNAVAGYLVINLTSFIAMFLYRIFNRTVVHGRRNFSLSKNTLICSNHRTMIDSYLVGHLSSWPVGLLLPRVLPYHPAAKENFFRNKIIGWFSARWRCIPVRRGVKDFEALKMMTEVLPKGQMIIFPEGTRSRTGELLEGRPGTGKLIHDTRCKVVPVYHHGMDRTLPIGKTWPRFFKRIDVYVGEALDLTDLYALPSSKETSKLVIARVMAALTELRARALADEEARAARLPWYLAVKRALRRPFAARR